MITSPTTFWYDVPLKAKHIEKALTAEQVAVPLGVPDTVKLGLALALWEAVGVAVRLGVRLPLPLGVCVALAVPEGVIVPLAVGLGLPVPLALPLAVEEGLPVASAVPVPLPLAVGVIVALWLSDGVQDAGRALWGLRGQQERGLPEEGFATVQNGSLGNVISSVA